MITDVQKQFILASAVVPEHLVDLMTLVSGREAHLIEEHLCVTGPQWLIVVGYPLGAGYDVTAFGSKVEGILGRFRPKQAWIVAPDLRLSLKNRAAELESHCYWLERGTATSERGMDSGLIRAKDWTMDEEPG